MVAILISAEQALSQRTDQSTGKDRETIELLKVLRNDQLRQREPDRVIKAVEQVGELKSIAAIHDLVKLLTFTRNIQEERAGDVIVGEHFITTFARYPAARALFRIGKPALPALIEVIKTEETGSLESENATYTVTQIFRDVPSDGVEYLRHAAATASSAREVERLSVAADIQDKTPKTPKGLQLVARTEKATFTPGEPILLKVLARNIGAKPLFIVDTYHPEWDTKFAVRNESEQNVALTADGKRLTKTIAIFRQVRIEIHPDEEVQEEFVISKLFEMTAPGTYAITVKRSFCFTGTDVFMVATSNTVKVTVAD